MTATDKKIMLEGVEMILGKKPYKNFEIQKTCDHMDDGYEYGETPKKITLRCDICGEYYEQAKP